VGKCFFWYRLTQVVPGKIQRDVRRCVHTCVHACVLRVSCCPVSCLMLFVQGVLEVQKDACIAGQRVIIVDDLLATGGEFLPCDATLAWQLSLCVCLSIRLSQVGVLLKQLHIGSRKQCHTIAQGLYFSDAKDLSEI